MDKNTLIRLAKEAGMVIYEGEQDRVCYSGPILEVLAKFAELAIRNTIQTNNTQVKAT